MISRCTKRNEIGLIAADRYARIPESADGAGSPADA